MMLPSREDMCNPPAHLEAYKNKGRYTDKSHYIRTLRALFHEGAIRDLREGIAQLKDGVKKPQNVGLFRQVKIGETVVNDRFGDAVTELSFDFRPHKVILSDSAHEAITRSNNKVKVVWADLEVDWESSTWLSRGSLLCLSSDGFNSEMLFATGHYREPYLTQGNIKVILSDSAHEELNPHRAYVMMEGTFYLPYAHVLAALESLGTRFPFEEELVFSRSSREHPPYMNSANHIVPVSNHPSRQIGLSQGNAIRQAMRKRLAVIQGPPGTGKTFVGLRIVNALLRSSQLWHAQGPILIVCTTNHALDQFLEGIIKENSSQPGDVVRFGGRSQSEVLEPYNAGKLDVRSLAVDRALKPSGHQLYRRSEHVKGLLINGRSPTSRPVLEAAKAVRELQTERGQILTAAKIRAARVVGMTTTFAAMHHEALQAVGPPIVIVEEAAEVLEAHQLAALSPKTQHLILIGDHQQLRPNIAARDLEGAPYHLDLSLFERLVNNNYPYTQLDTQRRMRPEISTLMRLPPFYPQLKDDGSVHGRPDILGMAQPVYFWFHKLLEAEQREDETSRKNYGEAAMVAILVAYLRIQGYDSSKITVITFYAAQVDVIRSKLRAEYDTTEVEVRTVDGYQGEESDIIILSTVRSRDRGSVGFLSNLNRATVAFSRARNGMYVVGNLPYIAKSGKLDDSQRHDTWEVIHKSVMARNIGGHRLGLRCQTHQNEVSVATSFDFQRLSPFGGCNQPCEDELTCGHLCYKICHTAIFQHILPSECVKPCLLMCEKNRHPCRRPCKEQCPPCRKQVTHDLDCGHRKKGPCDWLLATQAGTFRCVEQCILILPCGHPCTAKCATQPCPPCPVQLVKTLPCGHKTPGIVTCGSPPPCAEPCERLCPFGHGCKAPCSEPCPSCLEPRDILLPCGHSHVDECRKRWLRCNVACPKALPCGHPCEGICDRECPPCAVEEIFDLPCGHQTEGAINCYALDTYHCLQPCERLCKGRTHGCDRSCGDLCRPCWQHDFCRWTTSFFASY